MSILVKAFGSTVTELLPREVGARQVPLFRSLRDYRVHVVRIHLQYFLSCFKIILNNIQKDLTVRSYHPLSLLWICLAMVNFRQSFILTVLYYSPGENVPIQLKLFIVLTLNTTNIVPVCSSSYSWQYCIPCEKYLFLRPVHFYLYNNDYVIMRFTFILIHGLHSIALEIFQKISASIDVF